MSDAGLAWLHGLAAPDADHELGSCCASPVWAAALVAGRPYPDLAALVARSDEIIAGLAWPEVLLALAAHPRIGQRPTGTGREASWSRREQSGMDTASTEIRAALAEANRAYEDRFGHVLLIFAAGLADGQLLAAARSRLGNDERTERRLVRANLARIAALRVRGLVESGPRRAAPATQIGHDPGGVR